MAAIDKTYINKFDNYKKVIDWCLNLGTVTDDYGNIFNPIDEVYYPNITKEDWDKYEKDYLSKNPDSNFHMILWNTSVVFDIWLIRNCPFDFIQDTLKFQYNINFYNDVLNKNTEYDKYSVGEKTSKNSKLKIKTIVGDSIRDKNLTWRIEVRGKDNRSFWYDKISNTWHDNKSPHYFHEMSDCHYINGPLTKKNIVNMVRKWNIPINSSIIYTAYMNRYIWWKIKIDV